MPCLATHRPIPQRARARSCILVLLALVAGCVPALAAPAMDGDNLRHALFTWDLVIVGGVLVNLLIGILAVIGTFTAAKSRKEVQKREVILSSGYVTQEAAEATNTGVSGRLDRIEIMVERMQKEWRAEQQSATRDGEARISRIHERLDGVETKIAALPSNVVALLLNTKALHDHPPTHLPRSKS